MHIYHIIKQNDEIYMNLNRKHTAYTEIFCLKIRNQNCLGLFIIVKGSAGLGGLPLFVFVLILAYFVRNRLALQK